MKKNGTKFSLSDLFLITLEGKSPEKVSFRLLVLSFLVKKKLNPDFENEKEPNRANLGTFLNGGCLVEIFWVLSIMEYPIWKSYDFCGDAGTGNFTKQILYIAAMQQKTPQNSSEGTISSGN